MLLLVEPNSQLKQSLWLNLTTTGGFQVATSASITLEVLSRYHSFRWIVNRKLKSACHSHHNWQVAPLFYQILKTGTSQLTFDDTHPEHWNLDLNERDLMALSEYVHRAIATHPYHSEYKD